MTQRHKQKKRQKIHANTDIEIEMSSLDVCVCHFRCSSELEKKRRDWDNKKESVGARDIITDRQRTTDGEKDKCVHACATG